MAPTSSSMEATAAPVQRTVQHAQDQPRIALPVQRAPTSVQDLAPLATLRECSSMEPTARAVQATVMPVRVPRHAPLAPQECFSIRAVVADHAPIRDPTKVARTVCHATPVVQLVQRQVQQRHAILVLQERTRPHRANVPPALLPECSSAEPVAWIARFPAQHVPEQPLLARAARVDSTSRAAPVQPAIPLECSPAVPVVSPAMQIAQPAVDRQHTA